MSKNNGLGGLTFDRKLIQLQEQFKWLISSVANTKLNFNKTIGVREFPPFRTSSGRSKRSGGLISSDKFESMSNSVIKANSQTESEVNSDMQSPMKNFQQSNLLPKKVLLTQMKNANQDPKQNMVSELPEAQSQFWVNGFVWKKVYFKLYSKKYSQKLKKEMKALKHVSIEYLQSETSTFKLNSLTH